MPFSWRFLKGLLAKLGYGLGGALLAGGIAYGVHLQNRPDLAPWHKKALEEEFRAGRGGGAADMAGYLQLENRLFAELRHKIYRDETPSGAAALNRFVAGSLADPDSHERNWNRSFELPARDARAGVLLLHGLSDSPYSLRALGIRLQDRGAWVLGLRLPGHGTAPVGLTEVTRRDFAAAVRLAARHLAAQLPEGRPLYILGYSLGAALAVDYALAALTDEDLPRAQGLLLLSPALGITRAAAFAVWQQRVAAVTGLHKLAWNDILPEYDPFKYNSFHLNAGEQMYQLTQEISARLAGLSAGRGVTGFPPVLAFQSLADATVLPGAPANRLLRHLAPEGHELVLFDVNRVAEVDALMGRETTILRDDLMADGTLPFKLTLITNADAQRLDVIAQRKAPLGAGIEEQPLGLAWPWGLYSLSHVALPFPPDDPLYGYAAPAGPGLHLGRLEPRGERGLLLVSADQMLRLRANPFFPYVEERMLDFFELGEAE